MYIHMYVYIHYIMDRIYIDIYSIISYYVIFYCLVSAFRYTGHRRSKV